jgi:hypothetical protein
MTEQDSNPEAQEMLNKASGEVVGLYIGDQMGALLGTGAEQRDEVWAETAQENPAFGEQIRGLRKSLNVVSETKKGYPPVIAAQSGIPFMGLEDKMATNFLGDVLLARMSSSPGYIDMGMDVVTESKSMATEMGLQEGWRSEQARGVTVEKAVGKVLEGRLRVKHQPQQPKG